MKNVVLKMKDRNLFVFKKVMSSKWRREKDKSGFQREGT